MFTKKFITTFCLGMCVCTISNIDAQLNKQDRKQLNNVVESLQEQVKHINSIAENQSGDTERTLINSASTITAEIDELQHLLMQKRVLIRGPMGRY